MLRGLTSTRFQFGSLLSPEVNETNAVKHEEDDGIALPSPSPAQSLPPQQTQYEQEPPTQNDHSSFSPLHDAAVEPPHPDPSTSPSSPSEPLHRISSEATFPMKLYDILCNPKFSHAIAWEPHGRSWKVLNREYFMQEICPIYFAQTRYESFIRQVNGWGFKRLRRKGPDQNSYYHEQFLRGYPDLIDHMRRPASGEKTRDVPGAEPDLYAAEPMPQLGSDYSNVGAMWKSAKLPNSCEVKVNRKEQSKVKSMNEMRPQSFDSKGPSRGADYWHQHYSYGPHPYIGTPWAGYYYYAPPPPPSGYYPPPWGGAPPYYGWGQPLNHGPPGYEYPYPPPPPYEHYYENYHGYPVPSPDHSSSPKPVHKPLPDPVLSQHPDPVHKPFPDPVLSHHPDPVLSRPLSPAPPRSPQKRPRDSSYRSAHKRHSDSDATDEKRARKRPPSVVSPMGGEIEHPPPAESTSKEEIIFDGPAGSGVLEFELTNIFWFAIACVKYLLH